MHHPSAYRIRLEPMRRERKGRGGQHWYVVRDPYSCVLNSKLAKWTLEQRAECSVTESLSLRVSWSVSTQSFTSHLTPNRRRCVWGESVLFPNARGVRAFYISQYITRMHKTPSSVLNMKSYRFKIRLVKRRFQIHEASDSWIWRTRVPNTFWVPADTAAVHVKYKLSETRSHRADLPKCGIKSGNHQRLKGLKPRHIH